MKFVIFFCKVCSCCIVLILVVKLVLNEYILVVLIIDLDKKKRSKFNVKNYIYIKL